jgi:hypothetical protein
MRFINRIMQRLMQRPIAQKRLLRYVQADKDSSWEMGWSTAELRLMAKAEKLAAVSRKAVA